ncbi:unnamed protein product [Ilex paraguariensis]|uniref:Uncharacterized protein n=1 Tax=Ilex paraguariensis TaxID=185542 RepID=A0ABC8RXL4_9AQUA
MDSHDKWVWVVKSGLRASNGSRFGVIIREGVEGSEWNKFVKSFVKVALGGRINDGNIADLEGKTDMKIRALEVVEELRTKRADKQSMLLLDAFNKDRASLPQPLPNPPPLAPLPVVAPDPQTQEMINEKLRKAEDLVASS